MYCIIGLRGSESVFMWEVLGFFAADYEVAVATRSHPKASRKTRGTTIDPSSC